MNVIKIIAILWMVGAWGCAEWLAREIKRAESKDRDMP